MTCVLIQEVCKRPADVKDWAFDWAIETFRYWLPGEEYSSGTRVRPTIANGFEYSAGGNGQSSAKKEPRWPTTLGDTVVDGSITWTCVAISTAGLYRSITASTWTTEDATITTSGATHTSTAGSQKAAIQVNGGTDGDTKDVVNEVTFSDGVKLSAILRVTIEDEAD